MPIAIFTMHYNLNALYPSALSNLLPKGLIGMLLFIFSTLSGWKSSRIARLRSLRTSLSFEGCCREQWGN